MIDFAGFTYANIDEAQIDTAEARIALRPFSWLTLSGAYVYTDALDTVADTPLLRRPENVWLAAAEVARGGFRGQLSWRSVGEREDLLYGDDSFGLPGPVYTGTVSQYDVLRASLSYDFSPNATAYVAADNALDETYEVANGIASPPRTVTVGLRLRASAD